jgi:hypothetical protein
MSILNSLIILTNLVKTHKNTLQQPHYYEKCSTSQIFIPKNDFQMMCHHPMK